MLQIMETYFLWGRNTTKIIFHCVFFKIINTMDICSKKSKWHNKRTTKTYFIKLANRSNRLQLYGANKWVDLIQIINSKSLFIKYE